MPDYWLSLGSNLGNRERQLTQAIGQLSAVGTVLKRSSLYETKPVGGAAKGDFLNMVCQLRTALQPFRLLRKLKTMETELGRVRTTHWGNRKIDVDIIDWSGKELNTNILTIPHPFMEQRAFVLIPLAQCCPAFTNRRGETVLELTQRLPDINDVRLYEAEQEARVKQ